MVTASIDCVGLTYPTSPQTNVSLELTVPIHSGLDLRMFLPPAPVMERSIKEPYVER